MNFNHLSPHDFVRLSQQRLAQNAQMRGTATVDHAHGNCGCGTCAATADAARPVVEAFASSTAKLRSINAKNDAFHNAPALPAGFTADASGAPFSGRKPTLAEINARNRHVHGRA